MSSKIHLSRLLKTLHEWRAAAPNSRTKWGKGNMFGNHCYYTSFYDEKNTCFRWEYLAPCGRIFCVSPSVGTNLTGRLQTMGTAMEIYQTPCGKWSNLPKLSTAMANLWELFFFFYFVLQNLMKQIPVAFMFLFHGLSWNSFPYFCSAIVQPLWKHKQH